MKNIIVLCIMTGMNFFYGCVAIRGDDWVIQKEVIEGAIVIATDCRGKYLGIWSLGRWTNGELLENCRCDSAQGGTMFLDYPISLMKNRDFIMAKDKEGNYLLIQLSPNDGIHSF